MLSDSHFFFFFFFFLFPTTLQCPNVTSLCTFQWVRVLNLPWWPHHRRRDLETARHPRGRHHVVLRKVSTPPTTVPETTRDTVLLLTVYFYFLDKIFFSSGNIPYYLFDNYILLFLRSSSEKNLRDFAGNAMTTTVVGAVRRLVLKNFYRFLTDFTLLYRLHWGFRNSGHVGRFGGCHGIFASIPPYVAWCHLV
jgi:hypothetical protein